MTTLAELEKHLAAAKAALKKRVGSSPRNLREAQLYNILPEAKALNAIEREMRAASAYKVCTKCAALYPERSDFERLPFVGNQPSEDDEATYNCELRNCVCGSTIGIETSTPKEKTNG